MQSNRYREYTGIGKKTVSPRFEAFYFSTLHSFALAGKREINPHLPIKSEPLSSLSV